jgi:hypothetical protein
VLLEDNMTDQEMLSVIIRKMGADPEAIHVKGVCCVCSTCVLRECECVLNCLHTSFSNIHLRSGPPQFCAGRLPQVV